LPPYHEDDKWIVTIFGTAVPSSEVNEQLLMMTYCPSWKIKRLHFLLVHHSNLGHILHRFWDRPTATYWQKIEYFSYPSLIRHSLEFRGEVNHEETRVMGRGLLSDESCM